MARRVVSLDEQIEKAGEVVEKTKVRYDAAVDALEKLLTKRKEQDDKKVLAAYHAGDKSAEEIVAFINSKRVDERDV